MGRKYIDRCAGCGKQYGDHYGKFCDRSNNPTRIFVMAANQPKDPRENPVPVPTPGDITCIPCMLAKGVPMRRIPDGPRSIHTCGDPAPQHPAQRSAPPTITLPRELAERVLQDLVGNFEAIGGCDHSVNICVCEEGRTIGELAALLGNAEVHAKFVRPEPPEPQGADEEEPRLHPRDVQELALEGLQKPGEGRPLTAEERRALNAPPGSRW